MNRREFMSWVSLSAIASSLPVALAACSTQSAPSASSQEPPRADGFQRVGSLATLDQQGSMAAIVKTQPLLVIRDPAAPAKLIVVNANCSHADCTVNWEKGQNAFVCPCHSSKFASSGAVMQGPASKPLAIYLAKVEGDVILVKTM